MRMMMCVLAIACCAVLNACNAEPNEFVPGKPLRFPLDARPALAYMGQSLANNCVSDNKSVESECMRMMAERAKICLPDVGVVDEDRYRMLAKIYLACVMPKPICRGQEVEPNELPTACGL